VPVRFNPDGVVVVGVVVVFGAEGDDPQPAAVRSSAAANSGAKSLIGPEYRPALADALNC
jgi:hypothetical protein